MSKQEKRKMLLKSGESFGDEAMELSEIRRLEAGTEETDLTTITVGCTQLYTLICC